LTKVILSSLEKLPTRSPVCVVDEYAACISTRNKEPTLRVDLHTDGGRTLVATGFEKDLGSLPRLRKVAPKDSAVRRATDEEVTDRLVKRDTLRKDPLARK
jgi:hypothetical protein